MQKILITQGVNSLAFRIKNILSNSFIVTLASSSEVPSVLKDSYLNIPKVESSSFQHEMLKLAIDNEIDYILPLHIKEISLLSQSLVLFEEYGIKVLVPVPSQLAELPYMNSLPKELDLVLLDQGVDLISAKNVGVSITGLGVLSDSGDEFILMTV